MEALTQGPLQLAAGRGLLQLEVGGGGLEPSQEETPNPLGQRELSVFWPSGQEGGWSGEAC